MDQPFHRRFEEFFDANFASLHRYLARLTGDADLAADVVQEAFVKLLRRGSLPEDPRAWTVSVALNLMRNATSKAARRRRLLSLARLRPPPELPSERLERSREVARVRSALNSLPTRESQLLLLRSEGYSYREIAAALDLHEASIGTLLARARNAFKEALGGGDHASE